MERKEILETLKKTESEIREKINQANHRRNEIIAQAQKQAQKLENETETQEKIQRDASIIAAKKEIEKHRQQILNKASSEAEALKKKAQITKAKEFFLTEFQEYAHV